MNKEKIINNSVMKCCICNNDKIGEFITYNDKKYHLCCIEQLQNNWNELKKFNEEKLKQYQKQLSQATTDLEDRINYTRCYCHRDTLDKMQELENNNDNNT